MKSEAERQVEIANRVLGKLAVGSKPQINSEERPVVTVALRELVRKLVLLPCTDAGSCNFAEGKARKLGG